MSYVQSLGPVAPQLRDSRFTYHRIFSGVCKSRFNNFARGLLFKTAVLVGLITTITTQWELSKSQKLLLWPVKILSFYVAMLMLIITRKNYLHVNYLGYTSWISASYGQLVSRKWITYLLVYVVSAFFLSLTFSCCFFTPGTGSRKHSQHYEFCCQFMVPFLYSIQHVLLDLDRLTFNYGAQHQHPQKFMASRIHDSFLKCLVLTAILFLITPILLKLLFGHLGSGIWSHIRICCICLLILQTWDFTNIGFDAFLSIGCLHKGKPISSLSPASMETLITGLRSEKLFVKLTAFQELAYRATCANVELRLPIYHNTYRNSLIWPGILRECMIVIQETNYNVSDFLLTLKKEIDPQPTKPSFPINRSVDHLFGTNHTVRKQNNDEDSRLPGAPPTEQINSDLPSMASHRIVLEDSNVFKNNDTQRSPNPPRFIDSYKQAIFTRQPTVLSVLTDLWNWIQRRISQYFFTIDSTDNTKKKLSLFELYHISKVREAEKLCPVPVCYAECVYSMMGFIVNSVDEDPKGAVVSSVGEVLKILERSIGSLGSFTELILDGKQEKDLNDVISVLYDLCINAFLEIVLKYDTLLNDVYLDEDVVKLTQWLQKMSQDI